MKYKKGDKVLIVNERTPKMCQLGGMDKYLGEVMTIEKCLDGYYFMENSVYFWYDEMIEILITMQIWDILKKKYKWIAMDSDGKWYTYTEKPYTCPYSTESNDGEWQSDGNEEPLNSIKSKYLPKVKKKDWKESLFERGETW